MPLSERAQHFALGLTLLPSLLYLGGCAQTTQARSVEKSGFLGDYSMLRSGGDGQMLLRYRDESVDWTIYDSAIIDYRIAAGVDRRVGTKTYRGMLSNWSDVEQALDFWARELAKALARIKGVEYPE